MYDRSWHVSRAMRTRLLLMGSHMAEQTLSQPPDVRLESDRWSSYARTLRHMSELRRVDRSRHSDCSREGGPSSSNGRSRIGKSLGWRGQDRGNRCSRIVLAVNVAIFYRRPARRAAIFSSRSFCEDFVQSTESLSTSGNLQRRSPAVTFRHSLYLSKCSEQTDLFAWFTAHRVMRCHFCL